MNETLALQSALLAHLRNDPHVQAIFGIPARILADESEAPMFPFARLERHETVDASALAAPATEHRLTFAVLSREDFGAASAALQALRLACESAQISIPGRAAVRVQAAYADTMRTPDRRRYRGVIRLRIIIEEALA